MAACVAAKGALKTVNGVRLCKLPSHSLPAGSNHNSPANMKWYQSQCHAVGLAPIGCYKGRSDGYKPAFSTYGAKTMPVKTGCNIGGQ